MPNPIDVNRRQLLAGAGLGSAALMLQQGGRSGGGGRPARWCSRIPPSPTPTARANDMALAVVDGKIAAIGPTDTVLPRYPNADVYGGRGKALFPGLINCHAHLAETLNRGFNEDFGFPNSAQLTLRPQSLLQGDEKTLMVTIGALEAIKSGSTSVVEFASNISGSASALAKSGLRMVLMESAADSENVPGPLSPEGAASAGAPRFFRQAARRGHATDQRPVLRLAWQGEWPRQCLSPPPPWAETSSPELLKAVRAFAEKHDLGYSVHLSQSRAEVDFMVKHHGLRPPAFLDKAGFLGPALFAAHCRYMDDNDIALLGRTRTIVSHQAAMAANRGVIPPIPALRAAGCPIANGTDNNTNDMFEVMRVALLTERIKRDDAFPGTRPQPEDMLEDATLGGARALRQTNAIGSLEVGKKAD